MEFLLAHFLIQPVNVIELWILFLSIFSGLLLFAKPRLVGLSLVLGLEAVLMLFNFLEETGLFNLNYLVTPIFSLCTGPVFFLFVSHLIYAEHRWHKRHLIHFLPALVALAFTNHVQWVLAIGSVSILVYTGRSIILIRRYHRAVAAMQSEQNAFSLQWLNFFMGMLGILLVEDLLRNNLQPYLSYQLLNTWYFFHQLSALVMLMILVICAFRQKNIFEQLAMYETLSVADVDNKAEDFAQTIFTQIHQTVLQQQLFKQPRLSLLDLSKVTGLGVKEISSAINNASQLNFSEYINQLRVEYFIEHFRAGDSILDLAYESGFNSKSSFNQSFKQLKHQTPSQYLKTAQN